ncbi:hypothetical protein MGN70_012199 [Eutypa lata]|uniref:DUF7907 domain-containing protein n=1 Tax=Eutypa lata (strain UCR-EL1) TaxID=1287681 RepID=M7TBE2_EUTLA|nr:hypothetical protein UCREL1_5805 [Eutypa lata UCREL1]KAI1245309.1 hypothetical protein MGN70_012199 [Eutypa lata]
MSAIKTIFTTALLLASGINAAVIPPRDSYPTTTISSTSTSSEGYPTTTTTSEGYPTTTSTSTSTSAPTPVPTYTPSESFRLTAETISGQDLTPSVEGREVGFTKINETEATLVLVPTADLTGSVFSTGTLNEATVNVAAFECPKVGTRQDAAGVIVRPGGTFTIPSAWPVDLQCGAATVGVKVLPEKTPGADESLQYQTGTWMACEGSRLGLTDAVVALGFRTETQRPLEGCVDVRLVPTYV